VKTDVATGLGKANPDDPGVGLGEAPWGHDADRPVSVPPVRPSRSLTSRATTTSTRRPAMQAASTSRPRSTATSCSTRSPHRRRLDLRRGPATPGLPDSFTATSIDPGAWNDAVTATIEGSDDNFASSDVIATGVVSGPRTSHSHHVPLVPWVWSNPGAIRGDFQATGLEIVGDLGTPRTTSACTRTSRPSTSRPPARRP